VAICTLKFGGKHPWVDLKIKGGNCKPPLKVGVDTLFFYSVESQTTFNLSIADKRFEYLNRLLSAYY